MKKKVKQPRSPAAVHETARKEIISFLIQGMRSVREISAEIRISEKEIYDHLEHVRKSMNLPGSRFVIVPAECRKCGFLFSKRQRLRKPGKCPVCRSESIQDPLFTIKSD